MAKDKETLTFFSFLWFLLKALLFAILFVFLFFLFFNFLGIPEPISSILLVVIGITFFCAFFVLSCLWRQGGEIKKDDQEYERDIQKV